MPLLAYVGSLPYYVAPGRVPLALETLKLAWGSKYADDRNFRPITLLVPEKDVDFSSQWIDDTINEFLKVDDVFSKFFLENLFVLRSSHEASLHLDDTTISTLKKWNASSLSIVAPSPKFTLDSYMQGPYFLSRKGHLAQAWRAYEDPNAAFVSPTIKSKPQEDSYEVPPITLIPVPSRLYFGKPTKEKPLLGLRMAIKDVIDMKGVRTSAGNRAYQSLYQPRRDHARSVQQLLDAGAVIVGKTKTVQFACGANSRDWIEFLCPFNARGDGYQDPGCSSTGSAAAMGGYDWLDATLATDSFGSTVSPAAAHGLFAMRTSVGSVNMSGTIPVSSEIDAIGFFSRSIKNLLDVGTALLPPQLTSVSPAINSILYPKDWFPRADNPAYQALIDNFVERLETFLGLKRSAISISDIWQEQNVGDGKTLKEYLDTSLAHIQLYDCYHNNLAFRDEYKKEHGTEPFVDPVIDYKWKLGSRITAEQYSAAQLEKSTFAEWVSKEIFGGPSRFRTVMIMRAGREKPTYRHLYKATSLEDQARTMQGFGYKANFFPVLSQLPWVNIPIGQYCYKSTVTGRNEWLPASVGLLGPKGSDKDLLELASAFLTSKHGTPSSVQTGKEAFPVPDGRLVSCL